MYTKVTRSLTQLGVDVFTDSETLQKYATDESVFEVMPKMVVIPHTAQEVQSIVRVVNEYTKDYPEISLTARAAGTGLSGGSLNDSIILDIKELATTSKLSFKEGDTHAYLHTGPGVYFRDLQTLVEKEGYSYPPYPSSWRICTIGGMVVNNAAGPNSLKYGHAVEFVESLEVVLHDGVLHRFNAISYEQLQKELQRDDSVGKLYSFVWDELQNNYDLIKDAKPEGSKNTSGYELWDALNADSVEEFKKGNGTLNLVHVFCGSQGTIGIITNIELKLLKMPERSNLLVVPVYDQSKMGEIIQMVLPHDPYNVELYDAKSYKLALKNPGFFKSFFTQVGEQGTIGYFGFLWTMYNSFIFRFKAKVPRYTLMIKFDAATKKMTSEQVQAAFDTLKEEKVPVHIISNKHEEDMFWRIRGSSFSLAKLTPEPSRPAAFLEDMVVAPQKIPAFLDDVVAKLDEYKLQYAVHGHGGNGHFHFYPLFDFTDEQTPERLYKIAHEFYSIAQKHDGNICGEHNDGIIRTPFMGQLFSDEALDLFKRFEHAADPGDIFNPGKKVNPKFDIRGSIRSTN